MAHAARQLSTVAHGEHGAKTMDRRRNPAARRERARARSEERSTAIVDSLFVKSSFGGEGCVVSGLKRAKGLSIHAAIDKNRNILALHVWPGSTADAHAAHWLLTEVKEAHPNITCILGDKAYSGEPLETLAERLGLFLDASSPALPKGKTFDPMPIRWRIEQFFSWLVKWRRIARVWAYGIRGFAMDVMWSAFGLQLRRCARGDVV
jgi:hypothetical protein